MVTVSISMSCSTCNEYSKMFLHKNGYSVGTDSSRPAQLSIVNKDAMNRSLQMTYPHEFIKQPLLAYRNERKM